MRRRLRRRYRCSSTKGPRPPLVRRRPRGCDPGCAGARPVSSCSSCRPWLVHRTRVFVELSALRIGSPQRQPARFSSGERDRPRRRRNAVSARRRRVEHSQDKTPDVGKFVRDTDELRRGASRRAAPNDQHANVLANWVAPEVLRPTLRSSIWRMYSSPARSVICPGRPSLIRRPSTFVTGVTPPTCQSRRLPRPSTPGLA
jgi:hypothetical protein